MKKGIFATRLPGCDLAVMCLFFSVVFLLTGLSDVFASANIGGNVGNSLCQIPNAVITGNVGRAIATIGIITLGIMATLGRVTWGQAILVAVGISVIFGAATLAGTLAGNAGTAC